MFGVGSAAYTDDIGMPGGFFDVVDCYSFEAVEDPGDSDAELWSGLNEIDIIITGDAAYLLRFVPDIFSVVHFHTCQCGKIEAIDFRAGQVDPVNPVHRGG